jgi:hypothetical protein
MLQAYVYKVTNKETGQFYYGSRTNNVKKGRTPEEDLWKYYFTSSKRIKDMIEDYGIDSFEVEIVYRDVNYDKCFWEEQRLIIEYKENKLSLNQTYIDPKTRKRALGTHYETKKERDVRILKIRENKKGRFNSNGHYGLKHSEETRAKMREAQSNLGYKHSEETRQKMKGRVVSEETRQKASNALKGKPWSPARRAAQLNRKEKNNGKSSI